MAVWLLRAGKHGEYERKFLEESRVYVTWDRLSVDIGALADRSTLRDHMTQLYPDRKLKTVDTWVSQVWPFAHEMKLGDLVVLPSKFQRVYHIGEISGDYHYESLGPDPYFHWRNVKWFGEGIPKDHFGIDLQHSFGSALTICRVQRNSAENRLANMRASDWKPEAITAVTGTLPTISDSVNADLNLEEAARDQIAKLISARFSGHALEELVEAILNAQGYTTYRSPEGADGGVDILAGAGPLGFGSPRICVQVKSQDTPLESKALNELRGAMKSVNATEGLLVAWGGFKPTLYKQAVPAFFDVRLWTQKELMEALFASYDQLDEDLRAELPLKRIWTVATEEQD